MLNIRLRSRKRKHPTHNEDCRRDPINGHSKNAPVAPEWHGGPSQYPLRRPYEQIFKAALLCRQLQEHLDQEQPTGDQF